MMPFLGFSGKLSCWINARIDRAAKRLFCTTESGNEVGDAYFANHHEIDIAL